MKAPRFSYVRAASIEQVLQLLDEHGDDARILAGGQSLMPTLNMRLSQPRLLIDINGLDALKGISVQGSRVRIGALTRHTEVANSPVVAQHLPLIAEAMPHVAHVAVRTVLGRSQVVRQRSRRRCPRAASSNAAPPKGRWL